MIFNISFPLSDKSFIYYCSVSGIIGVIVVNLCIISSKFKILFSNSNNLSLWFTYNCNISNLLTTDHIYLKARSNISYVTY